MKLKNIMLAGLGLTSLMGATSCEDQLDVVNPNQQTTATFGASGSELDEVVTACYNRIRIEGTFARMTTATPHRPQTVPIGVSAIGTTPSTPATRLSSTSKIQVWTPAPKPTRGQKARHCL